MKSHRLDGEAIHCHLADALDGLNWKTVITTLEQIIFHLASAIFC